MVGRLDTTHRYSRQVRTVVPLVIVAAGGTGRDAGRAAMRLIRSHHGGDCPYVHYVEFDLCEETGRKLEPRFEPDLPGTVLSLTLPSLDCGAAVQHHRDDPECRWWDAVDPDVVSAFSDTRELGGWAVPQVARLALLVHEAVVETELRALRDRILTLERAQFEGWRREGPLHVVFMRSGNGAVGSSSLHLKDRLMELLPSETRVIDMVELLADHGRVTNQSEARALQQCALIEILCRSRRS